MVERTTEIAKKINNSTAYDLTRSFADILIHESGMSRAEPPKDSIESLGATAVSEEVRKKIADIKSPDLLEDLRRVIDVTIMDISSEPERTLPIGTVRAIRDIDNN